MEEAACRGLLGENGGARASTTDYFTLDYPEGPIFGPIPRPSAPQAAVTWPPPPGAHGGRGAGTGRVRSRWGMGMGWDLI